MGEPRDLLRWNPEPCSSSSQVQWFSQVEVLCELETFGFPILPTPVLVFTFGCCVASEEYFNQSWHLQSQRIKYLVWVQSNKSRTLHYKQQPRQLILNIMPLVDIYYSSVAGWQMLRERRSHPAFNKSHFAFVELSTKAILLSTELSTKAILLSTELSMKVILLSESSWRDCFRRTYFFTIFSATIEMVNLNFFNKFAIYDWFKV